MSNPDFELLSWFTDQLNLTTIIAVLSLFVSVSVAVASCLSNRRNLGIKIQACCAYGDIVVLSVAFENRSRLPIAITNIKFLQGSMATSCVSIPKRVGSKDHRIGNKSVEHREFYSAPLPIQLSCLGGVSCLILFEHLPAPPEIEAKSLTLEFCTNRGKAFQRTLPLTEEALSYKVPF